MTRQPRRPTLILMGGKVEDKKYSPRWSHIIQADPLACFDLRLIWLDTDQPEGARNAGWFRNSQSLPEVSWVLLGSRGQALLSGKELPKSERMAEALEKAGEADQVARLEAFLLRNPRHDTARFDLIHLLGKKAAVEAALRTGVADGKGDPGGPQDPEKDSRTWGRIALHLDAFFKGHAWATYGLELDQALSRDLPERHSPLMKALYRQIRPRAVELLRAQPDNSYAWRTLIRMDRVVGDDNLVDTFKELRFFRTPFHAPWMPRDLPKSLVEEARRTEAWAPALPVLRDMWASLEAWELTRPFPKPGDLKRAAQLDPNKRVLKDLWEGALAPFLEALVRGEREGEAKAVLASLDDRWVALNISLEAASLARRLGRPDLVEGWRAALAHPAQAPLSFGGPMADWGGMGGPFTLLEQHQADSIYGEDLRRLAAVGLRIALPTWGIPSNLESWQMAALGWEAPLPKWALVGPQGKVFLEGDGLPKAGEFFKRFQEAGLKRPLDEIRSFLKEHPDHPSALRSLARELALVGRALEAEREGSKQPPSRPNPQGPLHQAFEPEAVWAEYASVLRTVLGRPTGLLSPQAGASLDFLPSFPVPRDSAAHRILCPLAAEFLPEVETQLSARPQDRFLWEAWVALAQLTGRPLRPFIEGLEPSPLAQPEGVDREALVEDYAALLFAVEDWNAVIRELMPGWEAFLARMAPGKPRPGRPRDPSRDHHRLFLPLVRAFLRSGQPAKADELVNAWTALKPQDLPSKALAEEARKLGFESHARSWGERVKDGK